MQILQRNFPTKSPAKKRDKKADANTTCEKHGAQKKIFFPRSKIAKKKRGSSPAKRNAYALLALSLCLFDCSPEGVRAHAKGARAGHESSADLAS